MFALSLFAAFALATVVTIAVLADSGLRWWSAFGMLRQRMKQGYATSPIGQRPRSLAEVSLGYSRARTGIPTIRQTTRRAA